MNDNQSSGGTAEDKPMKAALPDGSRQIGERWHCFSCRCEKWTTLLGHQTPLSGEHSRL